MLKPLFSLIFLFVGVTVILSIYLQPNDFKEFCADVPSGSCPINEVDAIVAVSGGDTDARTKEAIKLYKNQWASKLIFSGAAQDKTGPSNAAAMKTIAMEAGVPESDILLDEYSANTKENAKNVKNLFADNGIKKIILVTSGYHQRRANLEFNRQASDVVIYNHPVASDKDWSSMWFLSPRSWILALSEITKIGIFYVTGLWS